MTSPWSESDIRVSHHPACRAERTFPQALRILRDPVRFPGAEIRICEDCRARVIVRLGRSIEDPDREALELSWRRDALEAESKRLEAEARERARVDTLREQARDLESSLGSPPGGPAPPNRGGRPRRQYETYAKRYLDAAAAIGARGDTPTYRSIAEHLGRGETTIRDWVRTFGLPVPSRAGIT